MLANVSSEAGGCPPFGLPHVHTTIPENGYYLVLLFSGFMNFLRGHY